MAPEDVGAPSAPRRVGVFGGSFDPPHRGHLAVAQAAADAFALDVVLLAPTGRQPLKATGAEAPFRDRLAMVELLCAADPARLRASALDAPRKDGAPNYTVELLERLRGEEPESSVFVVVGEDSFRELPRWRDTERLRSLAEWIVVSRPGFTAERDDEGAGFTVHRLGTLAIPLASRELRQRLRAGEDCSEAIPPLVLQYLRLHRLYGTGKSVA